MTLAEREALLNNFALRSFRDVADGDYIAARAAYRSDLIPQALWASQQAIEKYVKCILLLRRIEWSRASHSLLDALIRLEEKFPLRLSPETREFLRYVDDYGPDRYFIFPYYVQGLEIVALDRAVWEIRRYCIPYDPGNTPNGTPIAALDIKYIEDAESHPPQKYRSLAPGPLDLLIESSTKQAARTALTWKNRYFGKSVRKSISIVQRSQSANSPLALHPDILTEVAKYVYLPKGVRLTPQSYSPGSLLIRGIEHTCYEYANLMSAAHWSIHGSAAWRTHADDAFLLGYRKMHDFLLHKRRSRRQGDELPDILAVDYVPNGYEPNWTLPTWTREWREAMDRQLAHLSFEREKSWDHIRWVPTLENEFRNAWRLFLDAIDPMYNQEFSNQIAHCSRKPGFANIRL